MSFSALSLELLGLILDNVRNDKPSLSTFSLLSRRLCELASPCLFDRVKFVIDVRNQPLSLLLDALDRGPRLRKMQHLSLTRHEPGTRYIDIYTDRGIKGEKEKQRLAKKQGRSGGGLDGSGECSVTLPPNGHTNIEELHVLLHKLPELRSLSIIRLHIMPSPSFHIPSLHEIEELCFRGVDTANSYYALLALFAKIGTLSVIDNLNALIIAAAPADPLAGFSYSQVFSVDTLKLCSCAPKIMSSWFQACRLASDSSSPFSLPHLVVDEIFLLFEERRGEYEAVFGEMWPYVQHIEVDLTARRAIYSLNTYTRLFPKLGPSPTLQSMEFFLYESREYFDAVEKFVLSARPPNAPSPPSLRAIYINIIFVEKVDYWGDPLTPGDVRKRVVAKKWKVLPKIVRGLGWLEAEAEAESEGASPTGRFVCVRLWHKTKKDGGKVYLTDMLEEVVREATAKDPAIQSFLRFGLEGRDGSALVLPESGDQPAEVPAPDPAPEQQKAGEVADGTDTVEDKANGEEDRDMLDGLVDWAAGFEDEIF